MLRILFAILLTLLAAPWLAAQSSLLQSGPMLGYSEMREVFLWAQTTQAADVAFAYWPKGQPNDRRQTATYRTLAAEGFTARLIADQVEPGLTYEYRLLINGREVSRPYPTEFKTQPLWRWRTDPPAFTLAIGSCAYVNDAAYDRPGRPYGDSMMIFTAIHEKRPDAMLWLGDNVYLREADWFTWTGILYRNTHTRSLPEMQPLLAATHHYAIWDDHDFGPNNADRSYIHKDKTLAAFHLFWGNPTQGLPGLPGAISYFQYHDIDFFLLDNRSYRAPNNRETTPRTVLGREQVEWLIDALVNSTAPFKVIAMGSQFLNDAAVDENYINVAAEERAYILRRIEEEDVRNVLFLTGDRHHSELSMLIDANGRPIHDLTISSLTAGTYPGAGEANTHRVPGTVVDQRNFAILTFRGPRTEREVLIQVYNNLGGLLWEKVIASGR